mgnify:CR=1 FL=1
MIVKTLSTLIIASLPWLLWPAQGRADPSMAVAWVPGGEPWPSPPTEHFYTCYLRPHELARPCATVTFSRARQSTR